MSNTATKPVSITILGRRWFQRSYGNTYHTVSVSVDGETIGTSEQTYGYDNQYRQTAHELLEKAGYLQDREENEPIWKYSERTGIKFIYSVSDVKREKDL